MKTKLQWLAEIGMEHYAPMFEAQRIELDVLPELTDADLKEIGISALGDRKRILHVIAQGHQEAPAISPIAPPAPSSPPCSTPRTCAPSSATTTPR